MKDGLAKSAGFDGTRSKISKKTLGPFCHS